MTVSGQLHRLDVGGGRLLVTALTAREVVIEPSPFRALPRSVQEGLIAAADAYGAFLGRPARLRGFGPDRADARAGRSAIGEDGSISIAGRSPMRRA